MPVNWNEQSAVRFTRIGSVRAARYRTPPRPRIDWFRLCVLAFIGTGCVAFWGCVLFVAAKLIGS